MLRITTSDPRNTNRSVLQRVMPVISYMLSKLFEPYRSKKEYQTVSRFPMLFFTKNYYFYMIRYVLQILPIFKDISEKNYLTSNFCFQIKT